MKIQKSRLREIVKEELYKEVKALYEAPAGLSDAEDDNREKDAREKEDGKKGKAQETKPQKADPKKDKDSEAPSQDVPDDQENKLDGPSGGHDKDVETAAEVGTSGELSKELEGKTIQSITMDPKSKVLPGAQEVTITFSQIPEPLRILVNKVGKVIFHFKGLHQKL